MKHWSHRCESALSGGATKYTLLCGDEPIGFDRALDLMSRGDSFTTYLTRLLRASPWTAYRWETPPITAARAAVETLNMTDLLSGCFAYAAGRLYAG